MRSMRGDKKSTDHGGDMTMLTLSKTILLRGVWTRKALLDSHGGAKCGKRMIDIFSAIVTLKIFNSPLKKIFNNGNKRLKMSEDFIFSSHRINPSISRIFIGKENIIFKATNGRNRRHPNITMN